MWFIPQKSKNTRVCSNCRHFVDDPALLENELPGIHILNAKAGNSFADQGICTFHEQLLTPAMSCENFWSRDQV